MNRRRQGQILAAGLGFGVGLGFVVGYFWGWAAGIALACFSLGGVCLFVGARSRE